MRFQLEKYKLTDETIEWRGRILHRIECVTDKMKEFNNVGKGDKGGFVEDGFNLSDEGNCWIFDNAKVYDRARVTGNGVVKEEANVFANAIVGENATVAGNAIVSHAGIFGEAIVTDNAIVRKDAMIAGDAVIAGNAHLQDSIMLDHIWRYFSPDVSEKDMDTIPYMQYVYVIDGSYSKNDEIITKATNKQKFANYWFVNMNFVSNTNPTMPFVDNLDSYIQYNYKDDTIITQDTPNNKDYESRSTEIVDYNMAPIDNIISAQNKYWHEYLEPEEDQGLHM